MQTDMDKNRRDLDKKTIMFKWFEILEKQTLKNETGVTLVTVVCSVVEIPGVGELEYNIGRPESLELSCFYIF